MKNKNLKNKLRQTAIVGLTLISLLTGVGCDEGEAYRQHQKRICEEIELRMPEDCRKYGMVSVDRTGRFHKYLNYVCNTKDNGQIAYRFSSVN